jgi:hypothetical protein
MKVHEGLLTLQWGIKILIEGNEVITFHISTCNGKDAAKL